MRALQAPEQRPHSEAQTRLSARIGRRVLTWGNCPHAAMGPGIALVGLLLAGCSARHYHKSADKETYAIVQQMERRVFGHTNEFSIDTRFSGRDPKTIPPAEILDDRSASNRFVVNLDQALDLAVENSREYQTQKEQLYLTALSLTGQRYAFSPQFFAHTTPQIAGSPDGPDRGSVASQVGVSQLLKTGGTLTMALANDLVRYFAGKPDTVEARNSAINTLSVDLTQPLLRGFGINNPDVERLTQAERDVVYAIRTYSRYQQEFAVNTVSAYFALLTQKDIVRNNYRNYTNRVETTKYLQARAVDRERMSNADDARTAELTAKTDYIDSLASYLTSLDTFKLRLGIPLASRLFLEDKDLEELIGAGLISVDIDRQAAFEICVQKQMDVLNAIDQFEDSKRKVRVAADQLRADVNFFANASLSSEAPDDYTNFDPDKVEYTAGVRINLPVDRLPERNNYRATLVSFESELRSLSLTLDNFRDRIDRGLRTVEQARLNHLSAVDSLKVAQRRVENNVMLMEAGRATVRDVREAQDGLIQAQNNLATIYAQYLTARMNLLLNVGVIDTRPDKFWLLDPLREQLTPAQRSAPLLRMPDDHVLPPEDFLEPTS
ncbi:MAG TPA: TolC family protein [Candidatus Paceibacterota bacterium]|nr:TolC family protein [Verrucomicrobiota bacterium]HSA08766.1 TolC family protein [Candidatus Paceibacterota bacterium]